MTTNRMGLEQSTLSDGELTVITDTDHVQCGDAAAMASELLAYRKAGSEPVAYADLIALVNFSHFRERPGGDINIRGREWMWAKADSGLLPLFAAPPLAVTVPDGWIKFSEQAPPLRTPLLVCSGNGVVQLTLYGFDGEHWQDWYEEFDPIKVDRFDWWQLLPAAPKR